MQSGPLGDLCSSCLCSDNEESVAVKIVLRRDGLVETSHVTSYSYPKVAKGCRCNQNEQPALLNVLLTNHSGKINMENIP